MNVKVEKNSLRLENGFGESMERGSRFIENDDKLYEDLKLERLMF